MTDVKATQGFSLVAVSSPVDLNVTQAYSLVAVKYPAEFIHSSHVFVNASVRHDMDVRITQLFALVAVKGRVADPRVRAWTFTLDNHDFYVLRLGDADTLVFDLSTEQWSVWGNATSKHWRASTGINWVDNGSFASGFGSNVVAGDETNGTLYFLNPQYPYDDDYIDGDAAPVAFECEAQGQVFLRGPDGIACNTIQLTGSFGDTWDESLTDVTLHYSDDSGRTYINAGTISVTPGDYSARVEWRSLGTMFAPGRIFKVVDAGATPRLDSLDLENDGQ